MSIYTAEYPEKRDFHRMAINSEIIVTTPDGHRLSAFCKDLSGKGMQLQTDEAVEEGAVLETELPSADPQFSSFRTRVKVLRCEKLDQGFRVGCEIQKIQR